MSKTHINFQKLINGQYGLSTEMFVFDWMLKTGMQYEYQYGWYTDGMDKAIWGYSANNHKSYTALGIDYNRTLFVGFCNILCKTPCKPILEWMKAERAMIGRYRLLEMPEYNGPDYIDGDTYNGDRHWMLHWAVQALQEYKGKELKKELFHADISERKTPYIKTIKLTTYGGGWIVMFDFSFKETDGSAWTKEIGMYKGECIDHFINRANKEIMAMLKNQK